MLLQLYCGLKRHRFFSNCPGATFIQGATSIPDSRVAMHLVAPPTVLNQKINSW